MVKNYKLGLKSILLGGALILSGGLSAQIQLNQLTDFGSALYDINNDGKAVHGLGYYDFTTNTSSNAENGVGGTTAITNDNMVLGLLDVGGDYIPATRVGGDWASLPGFDSDTEYTLYDISENGTYIVGQTDWTMEDGAWGFIYNTSTDVYTKLSSTSYENGAAYAVNDDGIAVGWVDDIDEGTHRMPAYFTEDGTITLIDNGYGEAHGINNNGMIVGQLDGNAYIFDIASESIETFPTPSGFEGIFFSDISDENIVVGFAEFFDPLDGFQRKPFIFEENLTPEPMLITDLLDDLGVPYDSETFDGQAYKISSNGKYISGWTNGPAFMATGWALFLDDLFDDGDDPEDPVYCEPGMNCTDGDVITNVTFQEIDNDTACSPNGYGDYTHLAASVEAGETYPMSVTVGDGWYEKVTVWIDFGNDGSFDEEDFFGELGEGGQGVTTTGDITIPAGVAPGQYRMRVSVLASGSDEPGNDDPCLNDLTFYGEFEDYTVEVLAAPDPGTDDCGYETPSNDVEDGHGNLSMTQIAHDFPVEIGQTFTVEEFKFNLIIESGQNVDSADIYFYTDTDGNGPGEMVDSVLDLVPVSQEIVGDLGGFQVKTIAFEFPAGILLNGDNETETIYWIGTQISTASANNYWESTSILNSENQGYYYDADSDTWSSFVDVLGGEPMDGVFAVTGECDELGVSDLSSFDFAYYPNPVRDVLNIKSDKSIASVAVFNMAGQKVMNQAKVNNGQIDMNAVTPGVYVFRVTLEGGQVETFKVVKK